MLKFQCRKPNRTTMARTLNLALLLGHPIYGENSAEGTWFIGRHCTVPSTVDCILTVHSAAVFLNTAAELRQSTANTMTVHSRGICNVQLAACAVRFVESCEGRRQTDFEIAL